jgi:hypothetical protein
MNSTYHIEGAFFYAFLWIENAILVVLVLQLTVQLFNVGKFKSIENSLVLILRWLI